MTYYTLRRHKGQCWIAYLDPITGTVHNAMTRYDTDSKAINAFTASYAKGETRYLSSLDFSHKRWGGKQAREEASEPACKCQHYGALSCSAISNNTTRFWAHITVGFCRCRCHQDGQGRQIEERHWRPLAARRARRAG